MTEVIRIHPRMWLMLIGVPGVDDRLILKPKQKPNAGSRMLLPEAI